MIAIYSSKFNVEIMTTLSVQSDSFKSWLEEFIMIIIIE